MSPESPGLVATTQSAGCPKLKSDSPLTVLLAFVTVAAVVMLGPSVTDGVVRSWKAEKKRILASEHERRWRPTTRAAHLRTAHAQLAADAAVAAAADNATNFALYRAAVDDGVAHARSAQKQAQQDAQRIDALEHQIGLLHARIGDLNAMQARHAADTVTSVARSRVAEEAPKTRSWTLPPPAHTIGQPRPTLFFLGDSRDRYMFASLSNTSGICSGSTPLDLFAPAGPDQTSGVVKEARQCAEGTRLGSNLTSPGPTPSAHQPWSCRPLLCWLCLLFCQARRSRLSASSYTWASRRRGRTTRCRATLASTTTYAGAGLAGLATPPGTPADRTCDLRHRALALMAPCSRAGILQASFRGILQGGQHRQRRR
jgi:hypothetical protein